MSRVQLALNVTDLEAAIGFYSALFGVEPAKVRPGYANFAVADPPLKLVLIEGASGGTLNHLGVQVEGTEQVAEASTRLAEAGLATDDRAGETCCYAVQDKVWVQDPDRAPWEIYTVLEDADQLAPDRGEAVPAAAGVTGCC
ncbi:ArsI/CadI family heavy metal resistance metalloenzyme [Nitriliruptor alkaliphilus]|uniref:ArsI/CadI family heavy metal resistance metalloenzyme n=1 Tax=Nitriliruptor alkaliphilus TaxID=427918 RepID=UPI0006985610|nr:ArsI/CadI family heavy metal resistance metalloenzyme [Nitriliruptor alkaliphilus]